MINKIGVFHRRKSCRVCGSLDLEMFLDYGDMPLAGDFVFESELTEVLLYPMDLSVCLDCSLVQILNVVSPEIIFSDYRYLSSVTKTLSDHFYSYAELLKNYILPKSDAFVVEIGCNDGVLLDPLQKLGVKVLGVDAAENVVELTKARGVDVINGFFGLSIAEQIVKKNGKANVITASNVFAHIDDLDDVMRGVGCLLDIDGTFIIEVHYALDLLKTFQFDTVYHEHLCYYSLHSLGVLYGRFGLTIVDVTHLSIHGGSIRVFAKREEEAGDYIKPVVIEMLDHEIAYGINDIGVYQEFGRHVQLYKERLPSFLLERKELGRNLSGYGAAGRATILLNYCGIDCEIVEYIVDESPFRVNRYVPGVNIKIVPRSTLETNPTSDCLITAWNYCDEIVGKEAQYIEQGGSFIMPLPEIGIVSIPKILGS